MPRLAYFIRVKLWQLLKWAISSFWWKEINFCLTVAKDFNGSMLVEKIITYRKGPLTFGKWARKAFFRSGLAVQTVRITGLRENFSRDRGIEEPYWRLSRKHWLQSLNKHPQAKTRFFHVNLIWAHRVNPLFETYTWFLPTKNCSVEKESGCFVKAKNNKILQRKLQTEILMLMKSVTRLLTRNSNHRHS